MDTYTYTLYEIETKEREICIQNNKNFQLIKDEKNFKIFESMLGIKGFLTFTSLYIISKLLRNKFDYKTLFRNNFFYKKIFYFGIFYYMIVNPTYLKIEKDKENKLKYFNR